MISKIKDKDNFLLKQINKIAINHKFKIITI